MSCEKTPTFQGDAARMAAICEAVNRAAVDGVEDLSAICPPLDETELKLYRAKCYELKHLNDEARQISEEYGTSFEPMYFYLPVPEEEGE